MEGIIFKLFVKKDNLPVDGIGGKGVIREMRYGAMNFPVSPVIKELEAISDMGFDYLELTMDPPQAHYKIIKRQRDEILWALDDRKMGLICHLPTFISTADLTESLRDASLKEVLGSLEVASDLGAVKVVLHPSYITGLGVFVMDRVREYAMKGLKTIVEKADLLGLNLCIENMFPQSNSLVDPEDFVGIFKSFPTLRMTLDTGHANLESRGSKKIIDFIERFSDRIGHVHANDNFGKEDNHLPIGTGNIDFPVIIRRLKRIGYDDTITLEVFSRDREYLKISKEKLAAMFAHA